jgi:hypothetical protein
VSLSGRYFYAVGDLGEDDTPIPNPADPPKVRLEGSDANQQPVQRELPPDAQPQPHDTQLTITIPADLAQADALPISANLSVHRNNVQSDQVPITIN